MKEELILKRTDGTQYKIDVTLAIDFRKTYWTVELWKKEPGKRTWHNVHNSDDYRWRRLDSKGRKKAIDELHLQHVSKNELLEAKLKLYNKLKPV